MVDASTGGGPLDILSACPDAASRVLAVSGEVDIETAPTLARCLQAALAHDEPRMLIIDLAGVTFLGCAGADALVDAHATAAERGILLVLRRPRPNVRCVLDLTGVLEEIAPERDDSGRTQDGNLTTG
jgi:anti-anti-sigma factor